MVKKSFTLLELIIVIVIMALISVGTFKAIEMLYQRYVQANTITKFSILSQTATTQISTLMYNRVPITAIGYNPDNGDFKQLQDVDDDSYTIIEFIGDAFDAKNHANAENNATKGYSGFIDLNASNSDTKTLVAKDFNTTDINNTLNAIFNNKQDLNQTVAIIFSGPTGSGDVDENDYNNSFGWHGYDHNRTFLISKPKQVDLDTNLTMEAAISGHKIYAKYFLVDTAWAIARGKDINKNKNCLKGLNIKDDTLILFYNYRPWLHQTFCADKIETNGTLEGNASILAQNVSAFRVRAINYHIEIKIQFTKPLFKGSDQNISISKQKVVF